MIKTKESNDYTITTVTVFNSLKSKYGFSARLTDIWVLLREAFMIEEFEILDPKMSFNGPLQSFLIDKQIKWMNGEEVDFKDIVDTILKVGDFTASEKRLFKDGNIEERLWAIMLAVTNPGLDLDFNFKNNSNNND